MPIKNSKWKNIIVMTVVFFTLIMLFEIIPDYSGIFSSTANIIFSGSVSHQLTESEIKLNRLTAENKKLKKYASSQVSDYNNSMSAIISLLDESAEKSGCNIINVKPGITEEKNNLYCQPVGIELSAEYENLYNYIRFLENSARVIRINKLSIKDSKDSKLVINADIEAYLNL